MTVSTRSRNLLDLVAFVVFTLGAACPSVLVVSAMVNEAVTPAPVTVNAADPVSDDVAELPAAPDASAASRAIDTSLPM